MQDNSGKWKAFTDGAVLYGPSGTGQNLNVDLQKNFGDELDAVLDEMVGPGAVVSGLQVQTSTGLAVQVSAGSGFVSGQRVRAASPITVPALPATTSGIKIYVAASGTFSNTLHAWPAACGFTTGALGTDQVLLGTVTTDGSGVTAIVDNREFVGQLRHGPTAAEKAALAGTGQTAPSDSNKFVADDDVRLTGLPTALTLRSPNNTAFTLTLDNDGIASFVGQLVTAYIAQTISARHTFNPGSAASPFVLGVNAQGQLVVGLNADQLDGQEGSFYQNASNQNAGILPEARLPATVPRLNLANIFSTQQVISPATVLPPFVLGINAQGQLVIGLNADRLDGQEGSFYQNASNQNAGALPDARLSANIPRLNVGNTFTAQQTIAPPTPAPPLVLSANAQGQKVVGLNAGQLDDQSGGFYQNSSNQNAGTLPDARLSANVPRRDTSGTFTAAQYFSSGAGIGAGDLFWSLSTDPKYACLVRHSLNQSILNDGLGHALVFDSETHDPSNMHGAGASTITILKTGMYLLTLNVLLTGNTTGTFREIFVVLNGAAAIPPRKRENPALSSLQYMNATFLQRLTIADTVELQLAHNASVALDVLGSVHTSFGVVWVGP